MLIGLRLSRLNDASSSSDNDLRREVIRFGTGSSPKSVSVLPSSSSFFACTITCRDIKFFFTVSVHSPCTPRISARLRPKFRPPSFFPPQFEIKFPTAPRVPLTAQIGEDDNEEAPSHRDGPERHDCDLKMVPIIRDIIQDKIHRHHVLFYHTNYFLTMSSQARNRYK